MSVTAVAAVAKSADYEKIRQAIEANALDRWYYVAGPPIAFTYLLFLSLFPRWLLRFPRKDK